MGRIVPSGAAVFRQQPVVTGGAGGVARSTQFGPGEALQVLQLAEAVGGSKAVGALFQGLLGAGVKVADLFGGPAPDGAPAAPGLAGLGGAQAPAPAAPPFPAGAPDAPLASPPPIMPSTPAAPAPFPAGAPDAPEAAEDPRLAEVRRRLAGFMEGGGAQAQAVADLVARGAPPDVAARLADEAARDLARTIAPRDPLSDAAATALRRGRTEDEVREAVARRLAAQEGADIEALDVLDRAALDTRADRVLRRSRLEPGLRTPPPPAPPSTMDEALALAARARTGSEREAAVRAAAETARPMTLFDLVDGSHRLRAADQARRLFPREFAAAGRTPEEVASQIEAREALTERRLADLLEAEETKPERRRKLAADVEAAEARSDLAGARALDIVARLDQERDLRARRLAKLDAEIKEMKRSGGLRVQDAAVAAGRELDARIRPLLTKAASLRSRLDKALALAAAVPDDEAALAAAEGRLRRNPAALAAYLGGQDKIAQDRALGERLLGTTFDGYAANPASSSLHGELAAVLADIDAQTDAFAARIAVLGGRRPPATAATGTAE